MFAALSEDVAGIVVVAASYVAVAHPEVAVPLDLLPHFDEQVAAETVDDYVSAAKPAAHPGQCWYFVGVLDYIAQSEEVVLEVTLEEIQYLM